jgi:hypothetical protein
MKKFFGLAAGSIVPLGLAVGGFAMTATVESASAGPLPTCEIRVTEQGDMVQLEAVVDAARQVTGSYRLEISADGGGGYSVIDQSGDFNADGGTKSTLGMVTLDRSTNYVANLKIKWSGGTIKCTQRTS